MWDGGINADFIANTGHVNTFKQFVNELGFLPSWQYFNFDFTSYHEINGVSSTSPIDNFFWDQELSDNILDSDVIHHPSNLSDHSPIYCKINTSGIEEDPKTVQNKPVRKPSWKKSSVQERDQYVEHLHAILAEF